MPHLPETPTRLRAAGLRVTPQRMVILDVLQHTGGHLSVEEIFGAVRQRIPATDISTVYRTLESLCARGLAQRVTLGEHHGHFEWADEPHHHLICQSCGSVTHLGDEAVASLRESVMRLHRFRTISARLEMFGICAPCDPTHGAGEGQPQ